MRKQVCLKGYVMVGAERLVRSLEEKGLACAAAEPCAGGCAGAAVEHATGLPAAAGGRVP